MEQILNRLSEIETAAKSIIDDTALKKKALSEEMEKRCKEFDEELEKEMDERIKRIRSNLDSEKDARLDAFRREMERAFLRLDSYYTENHDRLSDELLQKILR